MTLAAKAKDLLTQESYTCVLTDGQTTYTSYDHGIKPLLGFIDNHVNVEGFAAADQIVGKAAAFLYILMGVKQVYANVMSKEGLKLLRSKGIEASYDQLTSIIINRKGDGMCPMELTVKDVDTAAEALPLLKAKVAAMMTSSS